MEDQQEAASQLANAAPSNGQLVQGLIGTIITLSSTLYQAIEGDDSQPEVLLQSLDHLRHRLVRLLVQIEPHETKVERVSTETHQIPIPVSARSQRPPTARNQPTTVTHESDVRFTPPVSSTVQETEPSAGINCATACHPESTADQTFVPPPSWREITNLTTFMAKTGGNMGEPFEFTDASGRSKTAEPTPVRRLDTFDRKTFTIDSNRTQGIPGVSHSRSKSEGYPFTASTPKHTLDKLFKAGTFAVRETSNYALPDGSFQRNTKTIAGPDASVLAKCSQPLLSQNAMLGQAEVVLRAPILPSAPPEENKPYQAVPSAPKNEE
uniref:Uncharacterized protein n=1 Tax=Anopheles farauti TaxID=69004 RepID=A0A182QEB4_9DIPT